MALTDDIWRYCLTKEAIHNLVVYRVDRLVNQLWF